MGYPNKTINRGPEVSFTADPEGSAIPAYSRCIFVAPTVALRSGKPVLRPAEATQHADVVTNEPIAAGAEGACFFANGGGEVYGVCAGAFLNAADVYAAASGQITGSDAGGAYLVGKATSRGYVGRVATYALLAVAGGSPPPPEFDVDAQALFDRIVAAGATIDDTAKDAVDAFCVGTKADGNWDRYGQISLLVGSNLAAALIKLKRMPGSPWSHSNAGFVDADYSQGSGLTGGPGKSLGAGFAGTDLDINNHFFSLYDRANFSAPDVWAHGAIRSNVDFFLGASFQDGVVYATEGDQGVNDYCASPFVDGNPIGYLTAVKCQTRWDQLFSGSPFYTFTRNASYLTFTLLIDPSITPDEIVLMAYSNDGVITNEVAHPVCFFAFGGELYDTIDAAMYARVQALQTALGRAV